MHESVLPNIVWYNATVFTPYVGKLALAYKLCVTAATVKTQTEKKNTLPSLSTDAPRFVADPRKGQEGSWRGEVGVTWSSLRAAAGWRGEGWVRQGVGEGIIKRVRWQLQQVPSKRAELHWAELMASVEPGSSTATAANIWSLIISRWTESGLITPHLPMGKASPVPHMSHKQ